MARLVPRSGEGNDRSTHGGTDMIRRTLLTLLAFVFVAGTAACGGGGDGESADPPADDETTAEDQATDDPADAADDGTAPDDSTAEGDVSTQLGVDREFTGEGSEAFCAEVNALRAAGVDQMEDQAAFADEMLAVTPPAEIATEWTDLFTATKTMAADPSADPLAEMTPEEQEQWGANGAVVAAYLAEICGLDG